MKIDRKNSNILVVFDEIDDLAYNLYRKNKETSEIIVKLSFVSLKDKIPYVPQYYSMALGIIRTNKINKIRNGISKG